MSNKVLAASQRVGCQQRGSPPSRPLLFHYRCDNCRVEKHSIRVDRAHGRKSQSVHLWYCCACGEGPSLVESSPSCPNQACPGRQLPSLGTANDEQELEASPPPSPPVDADDYRVRDHIRPFHPYIGKANSSRVTEHRAPQEPHFIDCDVLRGWLETCRRTHGNHCGPSSEYQRRPLWLIDAASNCIVNAKDLPYACLSYVWGYNFPEAQLELANVSELQKANSLTSKSIPKTVRDAFKIASKLGVRYLWVDRLCVVQDDAVPKQQQISAMADIYANADLTIIAAQGYDASVPLLPAEERRHNVDSPEQFHASRRQTASSHDSIMHAMSTSLAQTTWYSRGWTWQEYLFSRRRVIFHNNTVNWDCHCASWHEGQGSRPADSESACIKPPGMAVDAWPNMYRYVRMASLFNPRNLTFPEDVFDAFEGAISTFSPSFPGGFISGLPRMFFDASLLWQPYSPVTMRRRQPSLPSSEGIPSWSWCGWHGDIYSEAWLANCNYTIEYWNEGWEAAVVISTTKWFYSEAKDELRESVLPHDGNPLEPGGDDGWTEETDEPNQPTHFIHPSAPGCKFWYPVSLSTEPRLFSSDPIHIRARYIHANAKTSKALQIDELVTQRTGVHPLGSTAMLRDKSGNWAGYVRPMHDNHFKDIWGVGQNSDCVLVELSRSEVKNMGCPFLSGKGKMVNVMRVRSEGGVYHRLGVGRVEEEVWDGVAGWEDVTVG